VFAVDKAPGTPIAYTEVTSDQGATIVRKPTTPVILGGQERSSDLDLIVLHPVSPQIVEIDAKVVTDDGEERRWSRWFGIGGFPSRAQGNAHEQVYEPEESAEPESPAPPEA
jgi:hypothetical protein